MYVASQVAQFDAQLKGALDNPRFQAIVEASLPQVAAHAGWLTPGGILASIAVGYHVMNVMESTFIEAELPNGLPFFTDSSVVAEMEALSMALVPALATLRRLLSDPPAGLGEAGSPPARFDADAFEQVMTALSGGLEGREPEEVAETVTGSSYYEFQQALDEIGDIHTPEGAEQLRDLQRGVDLVGSILLAVQLGLGDRTTLVASLLEDVSVFAALAYGREHELAVPRFQAPPPVNPLDEEMRNQLRTLAAAAMRNRSQGASLANLIGMSARLDRLNGIAPTSAPEG